MLGSGVEVSLFCDSLEICLVWLLLSKSEGEITLKFECQTSPCQKSFNTFLSLGGEACWLFGPENDSLLNKWLWTFKVGDVKSISYYTQCVVKNPPLLSIDSQGRSPTKRFSALKAVLFLGSWSRYHSSSSNLTLKRHYDPNRFYAKSHSNPSSFWKDCLH